MEVPLGTTGNPTSELSYPESYTEGHIVPQEEPSSTATGQPTSEKVDDYTTGGNDDVLIVITADEANVTANDSGAVRTRGSPTVKRGGSGASLPTPGGSEADQVNDVVTSSSITNTDGLNIGTSVYDRIADVGGSISGKGTSGRWKDQRFFSAGKKRAANRYSGKQSIDANNSGYRSPGDQSTGTTGTEEPRTNVQSTSKKYTDDQSTNYLISDDLSSGNTSADTPSTDSQSVGDQKPGNLSTDDLGSDSTGNGSTTDQNRGDTSTTNLSVISADEPSRTVIGNQSLATFDSEKISGLETIIMPTGRFHSIAINYRLSMAGNQSNASAINQSISKDNQSGLQAAGKVFAGKRHQRIAGQRNLIGVIINQGLDGQSMGSSGNNGTGGTNSLVMVNASKQSVPHSNNQTIAGDSSSIIASNVNQSTPIPSNINASNGSLANAGLHQLFRADNHSMSRAVAPAVTDWPSRNQPMEPRLTITDLVTRNNGTQG